MINGGEGKSTFPFPHQLLTSEHSPLFLPQSELFLKPLGNGCLVDM